VESHKRTDNKTGGNVYKIGVLGGPLSLAHQGQLETAHNFLMSQIYFALGTFPQTGKIVVVGHDCGFYNQLSKRPFSLKEKKADALSATAYLAGTFPSHTVECFFSDRKGAKLEQLA